VSRAKTGKVQTRIFFIALKGTVEAAPLQSHRQATVSAKLP
jgi:hypothetical protein